MRKRGKYGLTIVFNTNKIGGFRLFYLVSTNSMTAATRCPGSIGPQQDELQQLLDRSRRIQTPKTPEKHHPTQKGGGPLELTHRARAESFATSIYYNRHHWTGVVQYKNGVIHKYFPNSIGKLLGVWYKLIRL
tara:strand:- start:123 stop:521 length:399 start_codon:yes stop_codon:yes gene_type:complete